MDRRLYRSITGKLCHINLFKNTMETYTHSYTLLIKDNSIISDLLNLFDNHDCVYTSKNKTMTITIKQSLDTLEHDVKMINAIQYLDWNKVELAI